MIADKMPEWYRQALMNSLDGCRKDLKNHQSKRQYHDAQARETLAEIQRMRRELGV